MKDFFKQEYILAFLIGIASTFAAEWIHNRWKGGCGCGDS